MSHEGVPTGGPDAGKQLFLILGPSGVGKTSIVKRVRSRITALRYPVSCTTRPSRAGERDGESYHFLSTEEFLRLRDSGALLEWDQPHGTHHYGILAEPVISALARGDVLIREIALQGLEQVRCSPVGARVYSVFIAPSSLDELARRIGDRGDPREIERRLSQARKEMQQANGCDRVLTVAEGDLDRAAAEMESIIRAEACLPT